MWWFRGYASFQNVVHKPIVETRCSLIDDLPDTPAQAGDVRSARRQLLALEAGDGTVEEAAYVALLTGCARAGRPELAKEWLEEMKAKVRFFAAFSRLKEKHQHWRVLG